MAFKHSKFVYFLEFIPLRIAVFFSDFIPLKVQLSFSRFLGTCVWYLLPKRRNLAINNVLLAKITEDKEEAKRIAKASFLSFSALTIESLAATKLVTPDTLDKHVEFDAPEETMALLRQEGQGVILVSAHLGNWEMSGHVVSFIKRLIAVARVLNNPFAQKLLEKRNPRRNMEIVAKHSADRGALLRPLKAGMLLGLIADQHATSNRVVADFMGTPAWTVTSPARLHLATKCPILCGSCTRIGFMKFRIEISKPYVYEASGDKVADIQHITQDMNNALEYYIRKTPEQYLWAHKRWRDINN